MKLQEGIKTYIEARQAEGTPWEKGAQSLRSLYRHIGDVPLARICVNDVAPFLDGPMTAAATWYNKYCVLRQFFCYWKVRNEIYGLPLPPSRRFPVQTFVPHVFSRTELHRLLIAAGFTQRGMNSAIGAHTFRTLLLFLYGTGAGLSEAVQLERRDVDFRRRRVTLRSSLCRRVREIPIGPDLYDILLRYRRTHHLKNAMRAPQFFLTKDGSQIKAGTANKTFRRVRKKAGIARCDGAQYQPRIQDLRYTFAVHRLTAWFRHGADMGRMIPALSAYLGQSDLSVAERYLRLTPERFRAQLNKLSPKQGKRRWRDDAALMKFLDSL
ncbi:tyrosine-type recombinase/integrase [Terriglobus albidus]|uniref:tyrosine-type recombinase/integrase n=1 Tax=Terriglobus albidus TaxID=1592106 RepID=UPI0021E07D47|nr:tyrosine-type recombinase/integrase [Terriglobus albidus]